MGPGSGQGQGGRTDLTFEKSLRGVNDASKEAVARGKANGRKMLKDLRRVNPKQADLVADRHTHCSATCPRRAGKTYAAVLSALITGEAKPGAISIIISLNKVQLRKLYWDGPTGIAALAAKYGVELEFNHSFLRWRHANGSMGYLAGADDDDQIELLRGLEADLYIIDEGQAFVPARLEKLLTQIIEPQRASRQGKIILLGTPGYLPAGPFWRATCPDATDGKGRRYLVTFGGRDEHGRELAKSRLWSFHHWTLQDNAALPHQWDEALITKEANGWADDHPTWLREYLGYWVMAAEGLVYRYAEAKEHSTWSPARTVKNPSGLPDEGAPWRLIGGLDIGFEDATAFVLCAYSAKLGQLRHVADTSQPHMLVDDLADMLRRMYDQYGPIEVIFADVGNLGKMVVETLVTRHGFPIERADKREKYDYIELLNSSFARGEVKIIEGTTLEDQLLTNAWDLRDGTKDELARIGRLRESPSVPNDSTDALLYLYRGSLHHFGSRGGDSGPEYLSPEWIRAHEKESLRKARESFRAPTDHRLGDNRFNRAPSFVKRAMEPRSEWQEPPTFKR